MSIETKIHLSQLESDLVRNSEWILAKRSVIEKVVLLFSDLMQDYKQIASELFPHYTLLKNSSGKISKGENYLGLPYVMMDYPAIFEKDNILAIRTFFWWGNFFSVTLHTSGKYWQALNKHNLLFSFLSEKKFFICMNDDEWNHTFNANNFCEANELSETQKNKILQKSFFKVSKQIELNKWNDAAELMKEIYSELIPLITISFQGDATDLSPGFPTSGSDL